MRILTAAAACVAALATLSAAQLPRKAPELQMRMPGNKTLELSQYKGKPVVLAFILTTCSHCQYTTGLLEKLQTEFASKGVQVIECAVNSGADKLVPAFTQQFKTNFPVGSNTDTDFILQFMQHPADRTPSMPMIVFIDRHGMIRDQYEGADEFVMSPQQEQNIRGAIQKLVAVK